MPTHSHCTSVTQSVRVNSERCYETLLFLNNRRRQLEVISLLTMTGPEVTWTGSHVDRKSRGPEVTWTGSHADRKSRGPEVTRTGSHVAKFNGGDWLNCWSSALLNFVASCAEQRFLAQRADAGVKSVNRYTPMPLSYLRGA